MDNYRHNVMINSILIIFQIERLMSIPLRKAILLLVNICCLGHMYSRIAKNDSLNINVQAATTTLVTVNNC